MRKVLTLVFYLVMVGIGSWAVYEWLVLGGRNVIFKAGGFLALFGAYLIWMDFLSPNRERL
jgi:CDP-diglyceride synthetase